MAWLVRCWEEPREAPQEDPVFRCFIRDLRTGEEHYLNDPRQIGELMFRQVRAEQREARAEEPGAECSQSATA